MNNTHTPEYEARKQASTVATLECVVAELEKLVAGEKKYSLSCRLQLTRAREKLQLARGGKAQGRCGR